MRPEEATRLCIEMLRGKRVIGGQESEEIWDLPTTLESGRLRLVPEHEYLAECIDGDPDHDWTWRQECESLLPRLTVLEKVAEDYRAAVALVNGGKLVRKDGAPERIESTSLAELDALDKAVGA